MHGKARSQPSATKLAVILRVCEPERTNGENLWRLICLPAQSPYHNHHTISDTCVLTQPADGRVRATYTIDISMGIEEDLDGVEVIVEGGAMQHRVARVRIGGVGITLILEQLSQCHGISSLYDIE